MKIVSRLASLLCLVLAPVVACAQYKPPEQPSGYQRTAAGASKYMVVTAHSVASETGAAILAAGGNAVDAAVTSALILNLVEPQSIGIGGGGYVLHHHAESGKLVAYDARESAEKSSSSSLFTDASGKPLPVLAVSMSGKAVGVPGTLKVLDDLHRAHGKLPWERVVAPAIRLAEEGFAVSPELASYIGAEQSLLINAATRAYFFRADGSPLAAGDKLRNPEFAKTLRLIAKQRADAFYRGEIASDIVQAVASVRGDGRGITSEDLAAYTVPRREPLCAPYRTHKVCVMPPSTSGGVGVLQMLGILSSFPMKDIAPNSPESVHLLSEAARLAFSDRNHYVADPDYVAFLPGLLEANYLAVRAQAISMTKTLGVATPGTPRDAKLTWGTDTLPNGMGSSHIAIVDADGNAVSMTLTTGSRWGSRLMVRGFLLNDQLRDFTFPDKDVAGGLVANRLEPGKRPRSSMTPVVVYDPAGRLRIVTGTSGGSYIMSFTAKNLVAMIDWGLDPQQAINLPNIVSTGGPTLVEKSTAVAGHEQALRTLGHEVKPDNLQSGVSTVMVTPKGLLGGADPRKEGSAAGR